MDDRRVHGELVTLGITVAASTVWEDPQDRGHRPGARPCCHDLGRLLALPGERAPVVRLHRDGPPDRPPPLHPRRYRALHPSYTDPRHDGAPYRELGRPGGAEPRAGPGARGNHHHESDSRPGREYPIFFDRILSDAGIRVVLTGVRMPRMNAITEHWVKTLRAGRLGRTLIWNKIHLTCADGISARTGSLGSHGNKTRDDPDPHADRGWSA